MAENTYRTAEEYKNSDEYKAHEKALDADLDNMVTTVLTVYNGLLFQKIGKVLVGVGIAAIYWGSSIVKDEKRKLDKSKRL